MVIASRYNIPYLLDVPGKGEFVVGEIYAIDEEKVGFDTCQMSVTMTSITLKLRHLDVLEDYPKYYTRRLETVVSESTGDEFECLVYFLLRHKEEMLQMQFMADYSSYGNHGKAYVKWYDQDKSETHFD